MLLCLGVQLIWSGLAPKFWISQGVCISPGPQIQTGLAWDTVSGQLRIKGLSSSSQGRQASLDMSFLQYWQNHKRRLKAQAQKWHRVTSAYLSGQRKSDGGAQLQDMRKKPTHSGGALQKNMVKGIGPEGAKMSHHCSPAKWVIMILMYSFIYLNVTFTHILFKIFFIIFIFLY